MRARRAPAEHLAAICARDAQRLAGQFPSAATYEFPETGLRPASRMTPRIEGSESNLIRKYKHPQVESSGVLEADFL
jgi:hypothetical protein